MDALWYILKLQYYSFHNKIQRFNNKIKYYCTYTVTFQSKFINIFCDLRKNYNATTAKRQRHFT